MNAADREGAGRTGAPSTVRHATPADAQVLVRLISLLAAHHGDRASVGVDSVIADLFSASPWATALVAEGGAGVVGYALLVRTYRAQFARRVMDLGSVRSGARRGAGSPAMAAAGRVSAGRWVGG